MIKSAVQLLDLIAFAAVATAWGTPVTGSPTLSSATFTSRPDLPPPFPHHTGCPTFTSTKTVCSKCAIPQCIGLATLTISCSCPLPVPTIFASWPCEQGCHGVGCATSYRFVTESGCSRSLSTSGGNFTWVSGTETVSGTTDSGTATGTGGVSSTGSGGVSTTATTAATTSNSAVVSPNAAGRLRPFGLFW